MIAHGDELGRTQRGNNNVYCQDNELSWVDWDEARNNDVLTTFTKRLTSLRARHPIFRRRRFFTDGDIAWLRRDGTPMTEQDWTNGDVSTMTVYLNGSRIPERNPLGEPITDDSFLLLFNPLGDGASMTLPDKSYGRTWETVLDTADPLLAARKRVWRTGGRVDLPPHSMMVMRCRY